MYPHGFLGFPEKMEEGRGVSAWPGMQKMKGVRVVGRAAPAVWPAGRGNGDVAAVRARMLVIRRTPVRWCRSFSVV